MARNRYFEDEELTYKFNKGSIKKALWYAKPERKTLITLIVVMIALSFLALVPPMINSVIIDNVIESDTGILGLSPVITTILLLSAWGMIILCDVIFGFFRTYYMSRSGHRMVNKMRNDIFTHLQKLAFDYYDSRPAGKVLIRVTNYLDEVSNIFSAVIISIIVETIKIIFIFCWLYILDWRLAVVVTVSIIPMGFAIFFLRKVLAKRHRVVRTKNSNRTAYVAENIQGTFVTKAFNRKQTNTDIYNDLCNQANKSWTDVIKYNELVFPTLDGFFYIGLLLVYAAVIMFATSSTGFAAPSLGITISFITYMGMFSAPLNNISTVVQQLSVATSNLERVFEVMETPPSVYDKADAYDMPQIVGHVEFKDVTFSYDNKKIILEKFNLDVPAGKMIALVGPTGAGKSTVINLISKFYDVQKGKVLIDDHDISKVSLFSLRSQVGVMMQDSFIFSGTILENIRYARPEASEKECIEASIKAKAHDLIMAKPEKYNTKVLENGQGLSAGEKQLISLARVILTDPKILILDEATSSIDTQTELLVQEALDEILKDRTSFVVAHRLSTIKKADCILFIADKGIKEAGSHDDLMAKKGSYYSLVTGKKE